MARGKVQGKPLKPPSGFLGKSIALFINFVEWCLTRFSRVGDKPVYSREVFPWVVDLEAQWPAIRAELDQVMKRRDELPNFQDLSSEVKTIQTDNNWKTFMFYAYGITSDENCRACPATAAALQKIPGMKLAFFSILSPRKHIPAHRGAYNGVLRCHLAMIVPEPREQVRIRVDDQICHWEEGKALLFDDSFNHEVWNDTDHWRVVLFIDFERPLWFPFNLLNKLIMSAAVFTPFIREAQDNQAKWEKEFYAEAQKLRGR